jgi:hypothetical protein
MLKWIALAILVATTGCASEMVTLHPQTMTWKDGQSAGYLGPFPSRHWAFSGMTQSCRGRAYEVLDWEDEGSDETTSRGGTVLIGSVGISRAHESTEHYNAIYVTYRCKAPVQNGRPNLIPDEDSN